MLPEIFSFQLFDKEVIIYSYSFFLLMSMVFGIIVLYWQLIKRNISTSRIFDNILWVILGGLIGARLFYILEHLHFYMENPIETLRIWHGGFDSFGALAGGFIVLISWLLAKKRKEVWAWLDAGFIALMSGLLVSMIGKFLLGSGYGRPSDMPWAIPFPFAENDVLRHPTQLYEFCAYALILILLLLISHYKYFLKNTGLIFFIGLSLYALSRFIIEFYRVADIVLYRNIYDFTVAHLLSLVLLICGVAGIIWRYKNLNNKSNPTDSTKEAVGNNK